MWATSRRKVAQTSIRRSTAFRELAFQLKSFIIRRVRKGLRYVLIICAFNSRSFRRSQSAFASSIFAASSVSLGLTSDRLRK